MHCSVCMQNEIWQPNCKTTQGDCIFHQCLLDRGHSSAFVLPLIVRATERARGEVLISKTTRESNHSNSIPVYNNRKSQLFLHLPYHPSNPPSTYIQQLWRTHITLPPNNTELTNLTNKYGHKIPINKLTITYSRAPNIGNLLS